MADDHKTDIVMKFERKGGAGDVNAECALDKAKGDDFMDGFEPQTYDSFSNFFEVQGFSYGFEVKDESDTKQEGGAKHQAPKKDKLVSGDFVSWRTGTDDEAKNVKLQLEFRSFKFERLIDSASPIFFDHLVKSKSFASAILVKRVSVGADGTAMGFLRLEFFDVLLTSLDWDDGDMTKEKVEFICKKFIMRFRPQKADGSLYEAVTEVTWKPEQT